MRAATRIFAALTVTAAFLCACGPSGARAVAIPDGHWKGHAPVTVLYENTDTVSVRDIDILMVCDKDYGERYGTLPLRIECVSPSGICESWKWRMYTSSAMRTARVSQTEWQESFLKGATMEESGTYTFKLSLDSSSDVRGILEVGIVIR